MTGDTDSTTDGETPLELLALPASTLDRVSQPAVRDAVQYFTAALITVPGARTPTAYATARDAAPDLPVLHPQRGHGADRVHHYRYSSDAGVHGAPDTAPPPETIDILAVQSGDVLPRLQTQLSSGERQTGSEAATYLFVPQLSVEWDTTTLSTTLPQAEQLAAITATLSEPVTVLAGGQPAEYYHKWSLSYNHSSVQVPISGLGASEEHGLKFAQYTCTPQGTVAAEAVDADQFGLKALNGVAESTAKRLRRQGCQTTGDVQNLAISTLTDLSGIGQTTAEKIHAHADVIDSGEPIVLTNKTPVKTRDDRPPLCLDIETDGLSPTIIWQFGVYDPATDTHQAFIEKQHPNDPKPVLEAFITWFLANHQDRTVLTWNGYNFDYPQITQFLEQHLPEYVEAWNDIWTYDLYKWAVRDGNALLPGRTNKLDHVARALGYDPAGTGLTGAQTAAAYQEFMRNPDSPAAEPDWERHKAYCEDDCRALWHVYQAITNATRRDMTDSGTGGATGQQAGLTDF
ncbi:ribonuclease H-like domain-containing protein [Halorussus limi]|uniref:Ribonuclease H-like domain-containing protein n=2 Tax=Halorussus TaxID=1070314 RepID=A0A8U0II86_9EURY|nr:MULTISPECIES: ribonuclease H-like domain-containing protein [Halorussus]UPV73939.1 ribonuclease H-like domain-containing protein [Halorussus limi]UPV99981.1 ribonuclease H-like domain-containing protein [Halorussus gelatinilyticus]